jgi:hypothetical protein
LLGTRPRRDHSLTNCLHTSSLCHGTQSSGAFTVNWTVFKGRGTDHVTLLINVPFIWNIFHTSLHPLSKSKEEFPRGNMSSFQAQETYKTSDRKARVAEAAKRHAALILGMALSSGLFFQLTFLDLSATPPPTEPTLNQRLIIQALTSSPSRGS